jgi:hypothetical protein
VLKAEQDGSKVGLEGSRWAADEGKEEAGPPAAEGEDLGSSIEGTVGHPRLTSSLPVFHPFM